MCVCVLKDGIISRFQSARYLPSYCLFRARAYVVIVVVTTATNHRYSILNVFIYLLIIFCKVILLVNLCVRYF